jgi:hypothetical protein
MVIVTRGVQHHLDDALHIPVDRLEAADLQAQLARDRGANLFQVQPFPLDLTSREHVGAEGLQDGFLPKLETEGFHVTDQPALLMADSGQAISQMFPIPTKSRSLAVGVCMGSFSALPAEIIAFILRITCVEWVPNPRKGYGFSFFARS